MKRIYSALFLLPMVGLAGCSSSGTDVESEQVETRRIWAGMTLSSKGNGNTRVKVELNEGGSSGSNIRLSANERLEANGGGNIVTLTEDVDIGDIDYEGTVPIDAGNTLFRVSLFRADGTINSGSTVSIPPTFEFVSPARGRRFTAGERLPLAWSPADPGGTIELEVSLSCPAGSSSVTFTAEWFDLDDTGVNSFDTGRLSFLNNNTQPPGTVCDMDIALRRDRSGSFDPAFRGGGFVRATQVRRVANMTLRLP